MSDLLTHLAVFEDCRRLIRFDDRIEPIFLAALTAEAKLARFGAIIRTEGHWAPPTLRWARQHWGTPGMRADLNRNVAFCAAALTHTACDRAMKALMQQLVLEHESETGEGDLNNEIHRQIYAYQDTYVFKKVFLNGQEEPFSAFMMAENPTATGQALERVAQTVFVHGLLSLRTMVTEPEVLEREVLEPLSYVALTRIGKGDGPSRTVGSLGMSRLPAYEWLREVALQGGDTKVEPANQEQHWQEVSQRLAPPMDTPLERLDNFLQGVQWLYVDHQRLVEAYNQPDPEKMERFRIETDFYLPNDPAIELARAVQRGDEVGRVEARQAFEPGTNRSHYGQALELGLEYLRRATDFWQEKTETLDTPNYASTAFRHRHGSQGVTT